MPVQEWNGACREAGRFTCEVETEGLELHVEMLNQGTPLGRVGQPAEIAPLYVSLADAANSYTSGSIWSANGGTGAA